MIFLMISLAIEIPFLGSVVLFTFSKDFPRVAFPTLVRINSLVDSRPTSVTLLII